LRIEVEKLKELSHPNIIKYLQVNAASDKQSINILLEYMPGGSVRNILDKFGPLEEKIIRIYMKQILEGLKYLHANNIVHNNLKCSNILVDNDATIRLSDFGITKSIAIPEYNSNSLKDSTYRANNSLYWTAPEIIKGGRGDKSSDIWSLGCLMYEMRTGNPPWMKSGNDPDMILQQIANSPDGPEHPRNTFSPLARSWVRRCIEKIPEKRPTVKELLADPFILQKNITTNMQTRKVVNIVMEEEVIPGERKPFNDTKNESGIGLNTIIFGKLPKSKEMKFKPISNSEAKTKEQRRKKCEEALKEELERRKVNST